MYIPRDNLRTNNSGPAKSALVKRAVFARENKGSLEALSPPPPVYVRIGESGAPVVKDCQAVSAVWTSVYVNNREEVRASIFTTRGQVLLKAAGGRKSFVAQWLTCMRTLRADSSVVKDSFPKQSRVRWSREIATPRDHRSRLCFICSVRRNRK